MKKIALLWALAFGIAQGAPAVTVTSGVYHPATNELVLQLRYFSDYTKDDDRFSLAITESETRGGKLYFTAIVVQDSNASKNYQVILTHELRLNLGDFGTTPHYVVVSGDNGNPLTIPIRS